MNSKKFIIYFSLLIVFFLPSISFATIVLSQSDSSTLSTNSSNVSLNGSTPIQILGNGLSGTVIKGLGFYVNGTSGTPSILLWGCTNSTMTVCNPVSWSGMVSGSNGSYVGINPTGTNMPVITGGKQYISYSTTTRSYTFDTQFYYISFIDSGASYKIYGCSSSCYSNGSLTTFTSTTTPDTTVKDVFFVFEDGVSNINSGQFVITTPTQNQITSSTIVPVSFTFYNNSVSDYYDKVGVEITNLTDGQQILPVEQDIIGSGSQTFSDIMDLVSTKQYTIRAYMRSSTGSSTPIYSSSRIFYTVSSPNCSSTQSCIFESLTSTSTLINPIATTTFGVSTTSGGIGSTTIQYGDPSSFLNTDIGQILRTKMPFSYLYDYVLFFKELAGGTKAPDPKFTFPTIYGRQAVFTDPATALSTTSFTVIDTSAIVATGYITQMRTVVGYSLYLMTGILSAGLIMTAF